LKAPALSLRDEREGMGMKSRQRKRIEIHHYYTTHDWEINEYDARKARHFE
jgi:hypothetical protein